MTDKVNHFTELAAINVGDKVEKKGGLSYLSWAWAVDQLLRHDPTANWSYANPVTFDDGTMLVACHVTAFDKTMTMQLPVMDHRNKPIQNPDAFQVNTAMQRCLVKAIALHGLGLYIYAGEDIPPDEDGVRQKQVEAPRPISGAQVAKDAFDAMSAEQKDYMTSHAKSIVALYENPQGDVLGYIDEQKFDAEEKLALWSLLPSNVRASIKKAQQETRTAA